MARVLIAGCGYVGTALGAELASESHVVWGVRRRSLEQLPGIRPIAADLTVPSSLQQLPSDLDFVFYLASPGGSDDPHYRNTYVRGLSILLETLDKQGQRPLRVFLASSTSVYAQHKGEWVDESSPTEPSHHSGKRVLEGERILLGGSFPGTVVRFAGIYGPRRTSLVDRVRTGRGIYSRRYTNRIHRDDCAGALRHLMHLDAPDPVYVAVDNEPAEDAVVQRWLAGSLGAPVPRLASRADGGHRAATNKRCRNERLVASGYAFRYPTYREGYGAILADLS